MSLIIQSYLTNEEILISPFSDYRQDVQEFEMELPENEETGALINNFEDVYIEEEKLTATLQKKVNQLK